MRINPERIARRYFNSWWLPFVAAFCTLLAFVVLSLVVIAFSSANYLGPLATGLLTLVGLSLLGIIVAAIWNLTKRRWAKGLVNLFVMLPLLVIPALSAFGILLLASVFGCSSDGFHQDIAAPPHMEGQELRLNIALMLQSYDPWDTGFSGSFIKEVWESCLTWGEEEYNTIFDLTVVSEQDIISGRLERDAFDVLIGPGGSGTWHAEPEFCDRIRTYISNGGHYLGVCGDAAFGTLGFRNVSPRLERVFLREVAKAPSLEPLLEVANLYTDLGAMEKISDWKIKTGVFRILFHPVSFYFHEGGIPTLKRYAGRTVKVNWAFLMVVPGDREDMPAVNIDVVYAEDWIFPRGSLRGEAAQLSTTYGKGRIILTGLHAELSRATYDIAIRNILWLAGLESRATPNQSF